MRRSLSIAFDFLTKRPNNNTVMYTVMISPECAPVAKVGGLGDVLQGLSWELSIRGNDVEIILPKYDCMRYDHIWGLTKTYSDLYVPFHDQVIHCDVWFGFVHGLKCFFIEAHTDYKFFERGHYYGASDDPERFAFFSKAALEFLQHSGKRPDIIHCHDWQTGLVPVMLYEQYADSELANSRVCYTIHNMQHQGLTGEYVLRQVGLNPEHYLTYERLLDDHDPDTVNLMKGGIVYSNFITTVSPSYMEEIRNTEMGHGMQATLIRHIAKTGGVLNGVDYNFWNPELDPHIAVPYGADSFEKKFTNKAALRERLLMRQEFKPLVAVISRLDHQKGVHLIRHAIFYALEHGCQFVLLGDSPDPAISADFQGLKDQLNDNPDCHLELGFDEELAHQIYAGADLLLVPSAFEPCGLTQLIAMRYGTVPVVRRTGGLKDTVFDAEFSELPYEERNGYTFDDLNEAGVESALFRAIGLWNSYPEHFQEIAKNGMNTDYSWKKPGDDYVNIYNLIKAD
jgi:starch synthase